MRPGDYLKAINYTKEDLFVEPQADKDYYPYIINRCLSYFIDTVLYANEMNRFPEIPKKDQFNYLKGSVRERKRFSKWIKKEEEKDIEVVKEALNLSSRRANEILDILTDEDMEILRSRVFKGGVK